MEGLRPVFSAHVPGFPARGATNSCVHPSRERGFVLRSDYWAADELQLALHGSGAVFHSRGQVGVEGRCARLA
jgi:hypothetical protein